MVQRRGGLALEVIASELACPPCNIGPASTPDYATLASQAIHAIGGGRTVFAGQRLEGFYVDLGAIFDLGDLRPFEKLHIAGMANSVGVNATNGFGVHSIAIQVPKQRPHASDGAQPTDPTSPDSVIGVWGSASRQRGDDPRTAAVTTAGFGRLGPGLAARQPADQRGDHPDGQEGLCGTR